MISASVKVYFVQEENALYEHAVEADMHHDKKKISSTKHLFLFISAARKISANHPQMPCW